MTTWPAAGREGEAPGGEEAVDVRKTKKMRAGPFPVWWSTTILYVSSASRVYLSCGSFSTSVLVFFLFFFFSFLFFPSFACVHTRRTEILADKMASHAGRVATQSRLHRERPRDNRSSRSGGGSIHCVNLSWGWHCLNFFLVSTYPRFFLFFFYYHLRCICAHRGVGKLIMCYVSVFFYSLYLSLSTWGRKGVWDIFAACNARGCFWRIYIYITDSTSEYICK